MMYTPSVTRPRLGLSLVADLLCATQPYKTIQRSYKVDLKILCEDPPTLSAEFFLFALVFLNRMLVGGAGRVVSEMGHTWAQVCPRINAPLPHSLRRLSMQTQTYFGCGIFVAIWFVCVGTFQHPSLSHVYTRPLTYTTD